MHLILHIHGDLGAEFVLLINSTALQASAA